MRFGDPGFAYGVTEAQTIGRLILRVANAGVLPMEFGSFADTVDGYVKELHELADDKRKKADDAGAAARQEGVRARRGSDASGRLRRSASRKCRISNLAALDNAVARVKKSAKAYDDAFASFAARGTELPAAQAAQLNSLLRGMEAALTNKRGLPGREWYRHYIYAPGLLTGYGVKTVPGVREAIEENQWERANEFAVLTADLLTKYSERLDQATALLPRAPSAALLRGLIKRVLDQGIDRLVEIFLVVRIVAGEAPAILRHVDLRSHVLEARRQTADAHDRGVHLTDDRLDHFRHVPQVRVALQDVAVTRHDRS